MTGRHTSYEDAALARRGTADYREGYDEARRAFLIGQAVRDRRLGLGLSQNEVAGRAGMTVGVKVSGSDMAEIDRKL